MPAHNVARRRIELDGNIIFAVGMAHRVHFQVTFRYQNFPIYTIWEHRHGGEKIHWLNGVDRPLETRDVRAFGRWLSVRGVPDDTRQDAVNTMSHIVRMWRGQK